MFDCFFRSETGMGNLKYRQLFTDCSGGDDWEFALDGFLERCLQKSCDLPIVIEVESRRTSRLPLGYRRNDSCLVSLWIFKSSCSSGTDMEDVVADIENWIIHGREDRVAACQHRIATEDKAQNYFLGFRKIDQADAAMCLDDEQLSSFALSRNGLSDSSWQRSCHSYVWSSTIILTVFMVATITLTAFFMAQPVPRKLELCPPIQTIHAKFTKTPEHHIASKTPAATLPMQTEGYIQFPTPLENEGPRRQHYLLSSNVSDFRMQHNISSEFTLRLDDQALMPTALVDEYELNVQQWFATNFPILASVRDSGNYLEPSYLNFESEDRERILLHERYHIAHCTTAFRRYLRAVQRQRHICPRDLDLGHLEHCANQLERFAYRPRETWDNWDSTEQPADVHRNTSDHLMGKDEEFDPYGVQVMLVWHTDVCY